MRKRKRIPRHIREYVYLRDGDACVFCKSRDDIHLDHIILFSLGGEDSSGNLRPLCRECNLNRHTSPTPDDTTTRTPVARSCVKCNPLLETDSWGFCANCLQYEDISENEIDKCMNPASCNCVFWKKSRTLSTSNLV